MKKLKLIGLKMAYRATLAVSGFVGVLLGLLRPGVRRRMKREYSSNLNLRGRELSSVVWRFFANYLKDKADAFFFPLINEENIHLFSSLEGAEHLETARAGGRGAVLIHTHIGNPQMLIAAIGFRGYRLYQLGSTPMDVYRGLREIYGGRPNPLAYLWLSLKDRLERALPVSFIHLGISSLREIYSALNESAFVAISIDGVSEGDAAREFLGKRTKLFSSGPARAAVKSGADLLPVFVVRRAEGGHRVIVEPPIAFDRSRPKKEAAEDAMMGFLRLLEEYARRYPWLFGRHLGFHNDRFFSRDGEALE